MRSKAGYPRITLSFRNMVPRCVSGAFVFVLAGLPLYGQSARAALPELSTLQRIEQEEFEPAVGKQILHAYEITRNKPDNPEAAGKLGMILQCYGKYELAEVCYRRKLIVIWPDGLKETFSVTNPDQLVQLVEGRGSPAR
jgi:hypothetical protein